jgi:Fe-S-cluster-containing dehydrogenase component
MKTWHLVIDVALCQGCNNCFMACKDEHVGNDWPGYSRPQSEHGEKWIEIPCKERGQYPLIDVAYRPTLCSHCADAPCVGRSGGIISKRLDGIVLIDPVKAAGRRDLVEACPYGMIVWSEASSSPQKCTLCAHLLDTGWGTPRCVQACGPGALSIVCEDDETFAVRADAEGLQTLHQGGPVRTGVCYKNLLRYDSCFIAGSAAVKRGAVVDCAAGAAVTLRKRDAGALASAAGATLGTTVTDAFGDFKFDGLEPESGDYEVEVRLDGGEQARMAATLGRSVNLGVIMLEPGVDQALGSES